jgi:hypothetical protein
LLIKSCISGLRLDIRSVIDPLLIVDPFANRSKNLPPNTTIGWVKVSSMYETIVVDLFNPFCSNIPSKINWITVLSETDKL